jgi:hypothetical protein
MLVLDHMVEQAEGVITGYAKHAVDTELGEPVQQVVADLIWLH